MNFSLRKPCKDCPFRTDIKPYLREERAEEIVDAIAHQQATFSCHKLNEHNDEGEVIEGKSAQHCAGALILLEKIERPNQMMRIAERLGLYDRSKLDMDAPVFDEPEDFVLAQADA